MKNNFFHSESWLWQPFGKIADFLILSVLWLFCSVPFFTAGAAFTALYDCSARCVKNGEQEMFSRYFRTFRREILPGLLSFLLWAVILGVLLFLIRNFTANAAASTVNLVIAYAMLFLLALAGGIASWVFPLLSRFSFRFADLNLTALRMALAYLPRTVALAAVNAAAVWVCLRFLLPVMVVPGIAGLISAYILEPVFKKYETGEPGENI